MSYILDALRKAEAERGIGAMPAPNVPQPAAPAPAAPASAWRGPWPWLAVTALAGISGAGVWLWHAASTTPALPAAAGAAVAQSPSGPANNLPVNTVPPVAAVMPPTAQQPAQAAGATRKHEPMPVRERQEKPMTTKKKAADKKQLRPPAESDSTASVATLRELPDSIQQQIPPLKIGGYIYSANQADRSVLINNRLLREGEEAAPGVTLEKMTPAGMVLSYKGYLFRVKY